MMKTAKTLAVAVVLLSTLPAASASARAAIGLAAFPKHSLGVVRPDPGLPPPGGAACLSYETDFQRDGATTYVTLTVRNTCAPAVVFDAKVDLVVRVIGSSASWVVDSGRLDQQGKVTLHGSYTSGLVEQGVCTTLYGSWYRMDGAPVDFRITDDRCH